MSEIATRRRPDQRDDVAPDGSEVRVLCRVDAGSTAEFSLEPGLTSRAVVHRTIEEVWYVLEGSGEMWRSRGDQAETTTLTPGTSLTVPVGTAFQFRSSGAAPLRILGVTIPPWPGGDESSYVDGPWDAST
jgi:mannose-6-phosphate isomerase-like protein (cupin superfamily)